MQTSNPARPGSLSQLSRAMRLFAADRVLQVVGGVLVLLWAIAPAQAVDSTAFLGRAMLSIAPVLGVSVALAAWIKAAGAEVLVSRAFAGREGRAIFIAAAAGALSPLCSCGVVPLIAGLLAAGVPLAPVMAFWLSSPVMDPVMFVLTSGAIGLEFAVVKTLAALLNGAAGGWAVWALRSAPVLQKPLRSQEDDLEARRLARLEAMQGATVRWRFWETAKGRQRFLAAARSNAWTLGRWLALAFVLESLMLAYLPADAVATSLGGSGLLAIPLAALLGIPAYLNGLAAIPLVGGLIAMGMNPAVGLTFMVAGGVTSIPAAMAVWALVKPRVFVLYIGLALAGALASGYLYAAWLRLA